MLFARSGAEVIKVERPSREAPEPALDVYLNGGKRRLALDRSEPDDLARIALLAASCDVFMTDAPAAEVLDLHLLDLGGDEGPRVRTSITPFGLSGPYRGWEATASTLLALSGHTHLIGDPGRTPLSLPGNYPHYHGGLFAFVSTMAAYLQVPATGGARIEVSELEALAGLHQGTDVMWTMGATVRSRHGNRWENIEPNGLFQCSDGWVGLMIGERYWESFALMIGRPDLVSDPRFSTNAARLTRRDEVQAILAEALAAWSKQRIFREGQEIWRIPAGCVMNMKEVLEDRHLQERAFWDALRDPLSQRDLRVPGLPFRIAVDDAPGEPGTGPFGPDTRDVPAESRKIASSSHLGARNDGPPGRQPLRGVRILDLTRVWAGPLAARILADLGADVIKVEALTGRGPAVMPRGARGNYPGAEPGERPWNRQGLFNKLSRNKRSVAIDLKTARGHELFLSLVARSDVVMENFSARAMPGLRLGYHALRETNERIIYLAMSAYGARGPYRDYIGLGPSIEPLTGLNALLGYSDAEPRATSLALTDAMAGTLGAAAIMMALERRERTGQGTFLDFSEQEGGVTFIGEYLIDYQLTGCEPGVLGNAHNRFAPHGVYRCKGDDEWIAIAARDQNDWQALGAIADRGWQGDPRFATLESRRLHREVLDAAIESWTSARDKTELMHALQQAKVPAGAVLSAPEWLSDHHLVARGYFAELEHPDAGRHRTDGSAVLMNGARGYESWFPAPGLGQHNFEVLEGLLGLSREEVLALHEGGVIADRPPN